MKARQSKSDCRAFFIMPITTSLQLTSKSEVGWIFSNDLDVGTKDPEYKDQIVSSLTFANGVTANKADELWTDRRTLTPSTPSDDIDLTGTSLQNAFGRDIAFVNIKGLIIVNKGKLTSGVYVPVAGEDLLIGATGAAANFFADLFDGDETARLRLTAGGDFKIGSPLVGYSVTGASSGDILRILSEGSDDITYDIAVWGDTA